MNVLVQSLFRADAGDICPLFEESNLLELVTPSASALPSR